MKDGIDVLNMITNNRIEATQKERNRWLAAVDEMLKVTDSHDNAIDKLEELKARMTGGAGVSDDWIDVNDRLPDFNVEVLIANSEGVEIAIRVEAEEDGSDCMGHDEGFEGSFARPGRSIGMPNYRYEAQGQPTHWMPSPEHPYSNEDPFPF